MRLLHSLIVTCGAAVLAATPASAQIGIGAAGLRVDAPARSLKELRDGNVVKQRFDFSCGAAALATILRYGFGDTVTEANILDDLFNQLTDEQKKVTRSIGFSLLDLQRVAQGRGYAAQGFRLDAAQLSMLGAPVIVFIEPRGYRHFAVLRGIRGDRVYLADPSRGNIRMPVHTFLDTWIQDDGKGIVFAVEPQRGAADAQPPLALGASVAAGGPPRPEIIAAREMLTIGAPLLRPEGRAR